MIEIREERQQDAKAVRNVNERAFGQTQEADLVEKLRRTCNDLVSLVAVVENEVVGHILFSPATIESSRMTVRGMALAPMAVLPEYQRQGIGSELVRAGIDKLQRTPCPFIIVLGHVEYYPRFGFTPASRYGIRGEWDGAGDAFMILCLDPSAMSHISGVAKYHPDFMI